MTQNFRLIKPEQYEINRNVKFTNFTININVNLT